MPLVRTSIAIEPELKERVRALAATMPGLTMSSIFVAALEMHLPHLEAAAAAYRSAPGDREEAAMMAMLRSVLSNVEQAGGDS